MKSELSSRIGRIPVSQKISYAVPNNSRKRSRQLEKENDFESAILQFLPDNTSEYEKHMKRQVEVGKNLIHKQGILSSIVEIHLFQCSIVTGRPFNARNSPNLDDSEKNREIL
jgi:hypothetical protein